MKARSSVRSSLRKYGPAALLMLAGCSQILGLEDRNLADGGGALEDSGTRDAGAGDAGSGDATPGDAGKADSEACQSYCDAVMAACTEGQAAYRSKETCLAVCAHFPPGDPDSPEGNTLACRAEQAQAASAEPPFHCPRAAPGGAGECGSNCEGYCALYENVCPELSLPDCERLCRAIPDRGDDFDAEEDFSAGSDTLQCRLAHLSAAAVAAPDTHCVHAQLAPAPNSPCNLQADEELACADYCRLVDTVCTGERAVYESRQQCNDACKAFDVGQVADTNANTLGCRRYHSYAALLVPADHCPHSGVGGDGHCGTLCATYCNLLESACGSEFAAELGDQEACEQDCLQVTGGKNANVGYSVSSGAEDGATIQCRLHDLTRALSGDAASCEGAVGLGRCQ